MHQGELHQEGQGDNRQELIGLSALARMAFNGRDMTPVRRALQERILANPLDADAMLDLSNLMQLLQDDSALSLQRQALALDSHFRLTRSHTREPVRNHCREQGEGPKLLVLMAPGPLMDNAPIEFLLESADTAIEIYYLSPDCEIMPELPRHDLLYVAIGQTGRNRALLARLEAWLQAWPQPVINRPASIAQTTREGVYRHLHDAEGLLVPPTCSVTRSQMQSLADETIIPADLLDDVDYPIIARPPESHAGVGLARLADAAAVGDYLASLPGEASFQISAYVDYLSEDGRFRKFRVVLIDGEPFAGHMAVSSNWMVHYLNADMMENPANRDEEAWFMRNFDLDFADRHADALRAIHERLPLDYLVIDCGETRDGKLLVFEVDAGAIIHDMDPVDIFPYKMFYMHKLFTAFEAMLSRRAEALAEAAAVC